MELCYITEHVRGYIYTLFYTKDQIIYHSTVLKLFKAFSLRSFESLELGKITNICRTLYNFNEPVT